MLASEADPSVTRSQRGSYARRQRVSRGALLQAGPATYEPDKEVQPRRQRREEADEAKPDEEDGDED